MEKLIYERWCEPVDLLIIDPGFQVHSSHMVCIALLVAFPVEIAAVKLIPVAVLP